MSNESEVKIDLAWVDTDDLLNELAKRHSACVFSGMREEEHDKDRSERRVWYQGESPTVVGLLMLAMSRLKSIVLKDEDDS
jgi:hypothetical protein